MRNHNQEIAAKATKTYRTAFPIKIMVTDGNNRHFAQPANTQRKSPITGAQDKSKDQ